MIKRCHHRHSRAPPMSLDELLMFHDRTSPEEQQVYEATDEAGEKDIIIFSGIPGYRCIEDVFADFDCIEAIMMGFGASWRWFWRLVVARSLEAGKSDDVNHVMISGGESEAGCPNRDVVERVFITLNDTVTRIRFSAVCRSWRWVAQCCGQGTPPPIWLSIDNWNERSFRKFFSLSDGVTHTLHLPEAYGFLCYGSIGGWLIMRGCIWDMRMEMFLIDPLSKVKIRLPIVRRNPLGNCGSRVVLSSAPNSDNGADNSNCLAIAVGGSNSCFSWCRLGDKEWITQLVSDHDQLKKFRFCQMVFHKGRAIVLESSGNHIMVLEFDRPYHMRVKIHSLSHWIDEFMNVMEKDLVEWCGELFLVFRDREYLTSFRVYKIVSGLKLVKVESLGDGIIFLFNTQRPRGFSIRDFPGLNLKGNCIYYISRRNGEVHVYDLEEGRSEVCHSLVLRGYPILWYEPNIRF